MIGDKSIKEMVVESLVGFAALTVSLAFLFTGAGCDLSDAQISVIAQNAGLGAAVTWIAYDNPDTNAIDLVEGVLDVIYEKSSGIATGETYTAAIYPAIEKFASSSEVPPQYKPIVLAGSLSMLNGLDLLFALNPNWSTQEGLALKVVKSFCLGAKQGLSLSERDMVMVQARQFSVTRRKIRSQK